MYKKNEMITKKDKWKYDSHLGYKRSWWQYYHNYKNVVDEIVNNIDNRKIIIDTVSLPLLFLIRHSLELGLKANILMFERINAEIKKISLNGPRSHSLDNLYNKFIEHLNCIKNKYEIRPEILAQMNNYLENFDPLRIKLHCLDKGSFNFRYPVDTKGKYNFSWDTKENIADILNLFNNIEPFLLFTEAVLIEEGIIELR